MLDRWPRYEHEVTIQTFGIEFPAIVYFAQDSTFSRNFLGRYGWLERPRIGIVDYDRMLFVGRTNPEIFPWPGCTLQGYEAIS